MDLGRKSTNKESQVHTREVKTNQKITILGVKDINLIILLFLYFNNEKFKC